MCHNSINWPNSPAQIAVDNGSQFALSQPDVVEIPANLFDVCVSFKRDPSATHPASFRLRISQSNAQKSMISGANGVHFLLGDGGRKISQENRCSFVQSSRLFRLIVNDDFHVILFGVVPFIRILFLFDFAIFLVLLFGRFCVWVFVVA